MLASDALESAMGIAPSGLQLCFDRRDFLNVSLRFENWLQLPCVINLTNLIVCITNLFFLKYVQLYAWLIGNFG